MLVKIGHEVLLEHHGQITSLHVQLSEASCCSKVNTARLLNAVPLGEQQEGGHLVPRHCLRELAGPGHDAVLAASRLGAHVLQLEVEEAVPEPLVGDHAVVVAQDQARALVGGIHTTPTPMGSPSWGIVSDSRVTFPTTDLVFPAVHDELVQPKVVVPEVQRVHHRPVHHLLGDDREEVAGDGGGSGPRYSQLFCVIRRCVALQRETDDINGTWS
jgi:hypothetical protein